MNKILIIANWKMNPQTLNEAKVIFEIAKKAAKENQNAEIVICPPFIFLADLTKHLKGASSFQLGGQNCSWEQQGAYTGEISPLMLKTLGCSYVIIGHSERRCFLNETDEMINKKIKAALKAGLKPVLCVGEKEGEDVGLVIERQLKEGLKEVDDVRVKNIIIAYEPVWAIGSGRACSTDDAMKAVLLIKKNLTKLYARNLAEKVKILYGGSVSSKNADVYIKKVGMDGLLVGGASLNTSEFLRIIKSTGL